jgi:hypothetical protein
LFSFDEVFILGEPIDGEVAEEMDPRMFEAAFEAVSFVEVAGDIEFDLLSQGVILRGIGRGNGIKFLGNVGFDGGNFFILLGILSNAVDEVSGADFKELGDRFDGLSGGGDSAVTPGTDGRDGGAGDGTYVAEGEVMVAHK